MKQKSNKNKILFILLMLIIIIYGCHKRSNNTKEFTSTLLVERLSDNSLTNKYFFNDKNSMIRSEDWENGEKITTREYSYDSNGKLKEMKMGNHYSLKLKHSNDNKTITIDEYLDGRLAKSYNYDSTHFVKTLSGINANGKYFEMKAYYNHDGNIDKHTLKEQGNEILTIEWSNYDSKKSLPIVFNNVTSLLENTRNNPGKYTYKSNMPNIEFSEIYTYQYTVDDFPSRVDILNSYDHSTEKVEFRYVNPN